MTGELATMPDDIDQHNAAVEAFSSSGDKN